MNITTKKDEVFPEIYYYLLIKCMIFNFNNSMKFQMVSIHSDFERKLPPSQQRLHAFSTHG